MKLARRIVVKAASRRFAYGSINKLALASGVYLREELEDIGRLHTLGAVK
jgi:hypothetical protein